MKNYSECEYYDSGDPGECYGCETTPWEKEACKLQAEPRIVSIPEFVKMKFNRTDGGK